MLDNIAIIQLKVQYPISMNSLIFLLTLHGCCLEDLLVKRVYISDHYLTLIIHLNFD